MVSIRRRKLLGLCSGRSAFLVPLPKFSENGHFAEHRFFSNRPTSVHPMPSTDIDESKEKIAVKVIPGSSNSHASGSLMEQTAQQFPEVKRRKRHRRKHFENQEPCLMRGVYFKNMKWQAAIKVDKKQIHLGTVGTQEEAARLYDRYHTACQFIFLHLVKFCSPFSMMLKISNVRQARTLLVSDKMGFPRVHLPIFRNLQQQDPCAVLLLLDDSSMEALIWMDFFFVPCICRAAFMCGREPNFELSEEEKQELRQFKWDDFLAFTRSAITNKKTRRRSGAGARRKSEPLTSALNSEEDEEEEEGGEPESNSFSASEDIEHDILFS